MSHVNLWVGAFACFALACGAASQQTGSTDQSALKPGGADTQQCGGTLSREQAAAVISGGHGALQACWDSALAGEQSVDAVTEPLTIHVRHDGQVARARLGDGDGSTTFGRCIEDAASGWRFPRPEGDQCATLVVPLSFGRGPSAARVVRHHRIEGDLYIPPLAADAVAILVTDTGLFHADTGEPASPETLAREYRDAVLLAPDGVRYESVAAAMEMLVALGMQVTLGDASPVVLPREPQRSPNPDIR